MIPGNVPPAFGGHSDSDSSNSNSNSEEPKGSSCVHCQRTSARDIIRDANEGVLAEDPSFMSKIEAIMAEGTFCGGALYGASRISHDLGTLCRAHDIDLQLVMEALLQKEPEDYTLIEGLVMCMHLADEFQEEARTDAATAAIQAAMEKVDNTELNTHTGDTHEL